MNGVEREVIRLDFPVPVECGGWRLDHFLKRRIGRLSRTKIQFIIREQISFADGRRARPSSAVRAGETIVLRRPAPVEPEVPRTFSILHEDEDVIVIDKPAGLPMHTTAKFWKNTLAALLRELYPDEPVQHGAPHRSRDVGRAAARAHARGGQLPHARVRAAPGLEDVPRAREGRAARRGRDRPAARAARHEEPRHDGRRCRRGAG